MYTKGMSVGGIIMRKLFISGMICAVLLLYPFRVFAQENNVKAKVTVNLFDYWLTEENQIDDVSFSDVQNRGINQNHLLLFGKGMYKKGWWNTWSGGSATPVVNIVKPLLNENGYPELNISEDDISSSVLNGRTNESLEYLFNPDLEVPYRKVYSNVEGLLQHSTIKGDYYSCYENFAQYDEQTNRFTLYDSPGVYGNYTMGQFFPFAEVDDVFDFTSGSLVPSSIKSSNGNLNHFFGMTIAAKFSQPKNGKTVNEETHNLEDMNFTFIGDDDVWIFLDGILISDLGGIHDTIKTQINFATGVVTIRPKEDDAVSDSNTQQYFLGDKIEQLQDILPANYIEDNLVKETDADGNTIRYTFRDDSQHELDIFYLERGHTDSSFEASFWPTFNGAETSEEPDPTPTIDVEEPTPTPDVPIPNPSTFDAILIYIAMAIFSIICLIGIAVYIVRTKSFFKK